MARKTSKRVKTTVALSDTPRPSRRDALTRMVWVGMGGGVILGFGGAFAMDFRNKIAEGDLSRIGSGTPTIVQIHDPGCALCRDLQRETRAALKQFGRGELLYLVANIQALRALIFRRVWGCTISAQLNGFFLICRGAIAVRIWHGRANQIHRRPRKRPVNQSAGAAFWAGSAAGRSVLC